MPLVAAKVNNETKAINKDYFLHGLSYKDPCSPSVHVPTALDFKEIEFIS